MRLVGGNHTILTSIPSVYEELTSRNVKAEYFDQIRLIHSLEELKELEMLETGRIYVEISEDIVGEQMDSISLEDFKGYLYLNGNGHIIQNCRINNEGHFGGLFSQIHPTASLSVTNLHLKNVYFLGSATSLGGFLGGRANIDEDIYSYGLIRFIGCSASACFFKKMNYIGSFIGQGDEYTEMYNCFSEKNFSKKGNVRKYVGNECFGLTIYPIYLDRKTEAQELSLIRQKK